MINRCWLPRGGFRGCSVGWQKFSSRNWPCASSRNLFKKQNWSGGQLLTRWVSSGQPGLQVLAVRLFYFLAISFNYHARKFEGSVVTGLLVTVNAPLRGWENLKLFALIRSPHFLPRDLSVGFWPAIFPSNSLSLSLNQCFSGLRGHVKHFFLSPFNFIICALLCCSN